MLRDALGLRGWLCPMAIPCAPMSAVRFYAAVRAFGGCGSFRFSDRYATLEEVLVIASQ